MKNTNPQTNEQHTSYIGHTPGPWSVDKSSIRAVLAVLDGEEVQVAAIFRTTWSYPDQGKNAVLDKQSEANARLIAAAPELLDALKRIIEGMEDDPSRGNGAVVGEISSGELRQARAVIAKAQREPTPQPVGERSPTV